MVSASDLGPEGREFKPWPVHPRCVLRQNTKLSQCLSPPRCINGNQQNLMLGDNLTKCWEVTCDGLVSHPGGVQILLVASYYTNLQWTSIPSRRSRNTPSCFILH